MRLAFVFILTFFLVGCKKDFPNVQTKVYGHAGESIYKSRSKYPPNTVESINHAIKLDVDGVEVDVQMTADFQLVAFHDGFLEENTDSDGCINSKNFSELANVKVYKSDYGISLLKDVISEPLNKGVSVMLDIKHYNYCSETEFDFTDFNDALNLVLVDFTPEQRSLITINCRQYYLLSSITDPNLLISFESDLPETAIPLIIDGQMDMLCIKLNSVNQAIIDELNLKGIQSCIYNIKTNGEINRALELNPNWVISDNISSTLKAING